MHHARERARAVVPLIPAILGTPAFGEKNRRAGGEREGEAKGRARAQVRPSRLSWRAPLSSLANIRHSPRTPHSHSHRMKVHVTKSKGRAGKIVEIFYPEDGACCVFFGRRERPEREREGWLGEQKPLNTPTPLLSPRPTFPLIPQTKCHRWSSTRSTVSGHVAGSGGRPLCLLHTILTPFVSSLSLLSLFFSPYPGPGEELLYRNRPSILSPDKAVKD